MAISSLVNRNEYTGTDSTAVYNYSFKIFQQSDLDVRLVLISTGVETALTLTTDYTVSGVGSITGGSITLVAGNLGSLYKLIIRRKLALTQGTSIKNQGDYYPELHENQFDKSLMIDQQQQEELSRSVKFSQAATGVNPEIPASYTDADSAVLVMKTDGSGFRETPVTLDNLAAAVAAADGTITPNRVYVSDSNGMPVASSATAVEAGYLSGATSNIQTQINSKEPSFSVLPIAKGGTNSNTALTNSKVIVSTGGALVESATTTTQLSYLDATSSIQTQMDSKIGLLGVVTRTSAYTATVADGLINCSSAVFNVTLYTAVGNAGRRTTVKKTDSSLTNIITILFNGAETANGKTSLKLLFQNDSYTLVSNGATWDIESSVIKAITAGFYCSSNKVTSTTAPIDFNQVDFDSHSRVTTGAAWKFTVPVGRANTYEITLDQVYITAGTSYFGIRKNGTFIKNITFSTGNIFGECTIPMVLADNDYIDIVASSGSCTVKGNTLNTPAVEVAYIYIKEVL